jgi:hypothetical protein
MKLKWKRTYEGRYDGFIGGVELYAEKTGGGKWYAEIPDPLGGSIVHVEFAVTRKAGARAALIAAGYDELAEAVE